MPYGGGNPTALARIGLCVAALLLPLLGPVAAGARQVVATRDLDCADFATQAEAQRVLDRDPTDPYGLDGPPGPETTGEPGVACDDETAVARSSDAAVVVADGPDVTIDGGEIAAGAGAGGAGGSASGSDGVVVVGDGTAVTAGGGAGGNAGPTGAGAAPGSGDAAGAATVAVAAAQPPADLDCEHFATQADAQLVLDDDPSDPYDLDPDGNGIACDGVAPAPTTATAGYAVPSAIDWPIPAQVGALTVPVRLAPGPGAAVVGPAVAGAPVGIVGPIQIEGQRGFVPIDTGAGVVGWIWLRYLDPASIGAAVPFAPMTTIVDAAPTVVPSAPPAIPPEAVAPAPTTEPATPPEQVPAGITAEEQAYLTALLPILATMGDSTSRAGLLLQNPLPGDPTWANRVTAEFVVWDQSYAAADALVPPKSLRSVHKPLVDAFRIYAEEGPVIAAAIAAVDAAALTDSSTRLAEANAKIDTANARLDEFQAGVGA